MHLAAFRSMDGRKKNLVSRHILKWSQIRGSWMDHIIAYRLSPFDYHAEMAEDKNCWDQVFHIIRTNSQINNSADWTGARPGGNLGQTWRWWPYAYISTCPLRWLLNFYHFLCHFMNEFVRNQLNEQETEIPNDVKLDQLIELGA